MGLVTEAGTRVTKSAFPSTPVVEDDPQVTIDEDIYETYREEGEADKFGTGKRLKFREGQVVRQSEIDAAYEGAEATITPATGPAAGGTTVTLSGEDLDGVTSVTFGGTPGTGLTVVSPQQVTVVSPAHAAGAVPVVAVDDSGNIAAGTFTYA